MKFARAVPPRTVARALADRGMLVRDAEGKLQRSERTPLGQQRVYVINAKVLEVSDDDE